MSSRDSADSSELQEARPRQVQVIRRSSELPPTATNPSDLSPQQAGSTTATRQAPSAQPGLASAPPTANGCSCACSMVPPTETTASNRAAPPAPAPQPPTG